MPYNRELFRAAVRLVLRAFNVLAIERRDAGVNRRYSPGGRSILSGLKLGREEWDAWCERCPKFYEIPRDAHLPPEFAPSRLSDIWKFLSDSPAAHAVKDLALLAGDHESVIVGRGESGLLYMLARFSLSEQPLPPLPTRKEYRKQSRHQSALPAVGQSGVRQRLLYRTDAKLVAVSQVVRRIDAAGRPAGLSPFEHLHAHRLDNQEVLEWAGRCPKIIELVEPFYIRRKGFPDDVRDIGSLLEKLGVLDLVKHVYLYSSMDECLLVVRCKRQPYLVARIGLHGKPLESLSCESSHTERSGKLFGSFADGIREPLEKHYASLPAGTSIVELEVPTKWSPESKLKPLRCCNRNPHALFRFMAPENQVGYFQVCSKCKRVKTVEK